jgi:hypothetical protein
MRRSFPLIMKYPPNSSGSSWCLTSSAEDRERRLQRTDCSPLSRSDPDIRGDTHPNHDWDQTAVFGHGSYRGVQFVNFPANFHGHTTAVGCQSFSGLEGVTLCFRTNHKSMPTSAGKTLRSIARRSLSGTIGRAIEICSIQT